MNLKANLVYSIIPGQELSTRRLQQSLFYKACASMDRLEGKCSLAIVWKGRGGKKEMEMHTFLLCFNHEGIKEYKQRKIYRPGRFEWPHSDWRKSTWLSLPEAAALIQDAYQQNTRFGTSPADGFKQYSFMLEYDTSSIDRCQLLSKLLPQYLSPQMLANVYLAALRRTDNGLLYDLSGPRRQADLGDRSEFLIRHGEEYRQLSFLKSGISKMRKDRDAYYINAYAIVSTVQEQLMRLSFQLVIIKSPNRYCVEEFRLTQREELAGEHPDNPLNYEVFCSVYYLKRAAAVKNWLEKDPDIFMIGELNDRQCYKWLYNREIPWLEYDITDRIMAEFIVTRHELIIYAKKPCHLARMEKTAALNASGGLTLYNKFYLPVRTLYSIIFSGEARSLSGKSSMNLRRYRAESALLYLGEGNVSFQCLQKSVEYKVMLGHKCWYLFCRKAGDNGADTLTEYYIAGNWLKVNVIKGEMEEEIAYLRSNLHTAVVYGCELENYYDLFQPPVSEQRKWQIYHLLKLFEKEGGTIREMGLVPVLRDVARVMGSIL